MEQVDCTTIPEYLKFPRTINHKVWAEYLGRQLNWDERCILEDYRAENRMNDMMKELYTQCNIKGNLYVPMLTNIDGNCLIESLNYYGIGENVKQLRNMLSVLMYIYKDYKGFLPNNDLSLKELFDMTNEIEIVCSRKKTDDDEHLEYYKYTYNVMCQDLSNSHSWQRLPTQLILMVVSYVFKVEIIIVSNMGSYENVINAFESVTPKPSLFTVYLGHLGESHYIPLDILNPDKEELDPLFYRDAKHKLIEWATFMEKIKINNYYEELLKKQKVNEILVTESIKVETDQISDSNITTFVDVAAITGNNNNNDNDSYVSF
ncbi:OTU domain-containing protein [Fadolivirus algeromassiliense]|jgi:hypothetical protein|uniref:OTU domain-containing protein n=1 Tax=Fadolivirus FV1/VV64 TaxID=3070911 RepID=A0A7D3UQD5_9VIRU|nr:OTU domain-containing protein [Fadolivirus algeromassiliense]QKF93693.1 OTU domain-containing protein [Fadolivirus FV1/VV64]